MLLSLLMTFVSSLFKYSKVISVEHQNKNTTFQIFPNPVNDYVEIKTNQKGRCQIIDISGKILLEKDIINLSRMNVSDLPNGIYFIKAYLEEPVTLKIIKQ